MKKKKTTEKEGGKSQVNYASLIIRVVTFVGMFIVVCVCIFLFIFTSVFTYVSIKRRVRGQRQHR